MGNRLDLAPFTYVEKLEGLREIQSRKFCYSDILHQKHTKGEEVFENTGVKQVGAGCTIKAIKETGVARPKYRAYRHGKQLITEREVGH